LLGLAGTGVWLISGVPSTTADTVQTVAIPSYFYPDGDGANGLWYQMEAAFPTVGLAIINPNSGPGDAINQDYVHQVVRSQAAGLTVMGYTHTSYGTRDQSQVLSEIDKYYDWYKVDGIFLDEVSTDCNYADSYYKGLYDYIKAKTSVKGQLVVLNPGTRTRECYLSVGDILLTFEDTFLVYRQITWPPGWEANYPTDRFWHLVIRAGTTEDMKDAVSLSKQRHAGWVYVTPDRGPNPWDTLPSEPYWSEELTAVVGAPAEEPPPPNPPELKTLLVTANLNRNPPNYTNGEIVEITAQVSDSAGSVEGAAVYFRFTTAKNGLLECNILSNSNGVAICSYRVKANRDGYGSYTVEVTASKSGYNPSDTIVVSFTVQLPDQLAASQGTSVPVSFR
jgi:hypothetical protein